MDKVVQLNLFVLIGPIFVVEFRSSYFPLYLNFPKGSFLARAQQFIFLTSKFHFAEFTLPSIAIDAVYIGHWFQERHPLNQSVNLLFCR